MMRETTDEGSASSQATTPALSKGEFKKSIEAAKADLRALIAENEQKVKLEMARSQGKSAMGIGVTVGRQRAGGIEFKRGLAPVNGKEFSDWQNRIEHEGFKAYPFLIPANVSVETEPSTASFRFFLDDRSLGFSMPAKPLQTAFHRANRDEDVAMAFIDELEAVPDIAVLASAVSTMGKSLNVTASNVNKLAKKLAQLHHEGRIGFLERPKEETAAANPYSENPEVGRF